MRRSLARRAFLLPVVSGGGAPIISVSPSSWDFGSTPVGSPVTKEFTILNSGNGTLEITLPITIAGSGFTVTAQPASTSLAPGASTTFTVQADAIIDDNASGNISIVSNAASSPTVVAITATVTPITNGLVAFYDASYAPTLWEDSARTIQAADNADVIGAEDDKSGGGYHITQPTTGNKSTLRTAIQNGLNIIRFDGVDDFLRNSAFADFGDNYTIFAVFKYASGGGEIQIAFEVSSAANNSGFLIGYVFGAFFRARDASGLRDIAGGDIRDDVFRSHRAVNTGSLLQYWINNVSIGTVAYTAPNPNTLSRLTVGADPAGGNRAKIDFARLAIYNRTLTAPEQATMELAQKTKWGVY